MANPFPLIPALDIISFWILFFLTIHLWRRQKQVAFLALKSFTWFFAFITTMTLTLSLPGLFFKNLLQIQFLLNIADIFLYAGLAFLARTLGLLLWPKNNFVTLVFPVFLIFLGIVSVIWKMANLLPAKMNLVQGTPFVFYQDTAPFLPNAILGFLSLLVFSLGCLAFFLQAKGQEDPFLRRRSQLFSLGFALGLMSSISAYIFNNVFPGQLIFPFFAAFSFLAGLFIGWIAIQVVHTSSSA